MTLKQRVLALERQREVARDRIERLESQLSAVLTLLNIEIKNNETVAIYTVTERTLKKWRAEAENTKEIRELCERISKLTQELIDQHTLERMKSG